MAIKEKNLSLKPWAVISEISLEPRQGLVTAARPRLGSHPPLLSPRIVLSPLGSEQIPLREKGGPPWLPPAGQGLPVCFSLVSEKPKLASLLFLFSGASKLYLRKGLLCSGDPILSWGMGEAMSERKMVFDKLVQLGQSHDLPVTAHHCFTEAIVSVPKYLAK